MNRRTTWIAVALLALHYALAVGSKFNASTTSDELVHLTAGTSYWQNHDYRLHPENGNLPQRWAAIPTALAGAKFPEMKGNEYWRTSDAWTVGHQFFYETGEDHFPRLMAGRAMIGLFSVATGWLVFCWSRRLFGDAGALVSLAFFVFCTDFLAHGALVTSDVCAAFFLLAAAGLWWRQLHDGRARVWWLSAATTGLAFVAKYSGGILLPLMAAMAVVRMLAPEPLTFAGRTFTSPFGKLGAATLSALGHGLVVVATIWVFYGFRYSGFNPALPPADHFIRDWAYMLQGTGLPGKAIHAFAQAHLLPEAYLYGFLYVLKTIGLRSAFLNGEYSVTGWPSFFLWTFGLKTTLALLLTSALVAGLTLRRWLHGGPWRQDLYRVTPLVALFVIYWITSLTSHLNIGHRHILPTYPVLFIAAGVLGVWATRATWRRVAAGVLVAWHMAAAAFVAPHFLTYFNEITGGPRNGWRHLVDSSLDWGQELPGLKRWLDQHPDARPVFLSYFGSGSPDYYRIRAQRLPFATVFHFPPVHINLSAGTYCISATMLQQVYTPVRGEWSLTYEREYLALRDLEPAFDAYTRDPVQRAELIRTAPVGRWDKAITRYEWLRLSRLCHFLRVRAPDATIGNSIFIFRLTEDEVTAATKGSLKDWQALIERTIVANP